MAEQSQEYTISHSGTVLGDSMVDTQQNQVNPQRPTSVISFECPKKFEQIEYIGRRDATRFVPRTKELFSGDGSTTTFSLTADIQPIAGDEQIGEQDYPVVVGYDSAAASRLSVSSVDYAANSVTFESAPSAGTDNVNIFPVVTEGAVQFRGVNQFDQVEGHVQNWEVPIYRWHDFEQLKEGREVNLDGQIAWGRYERMEVLVDSPRNVIWTDANYPDGEYVSTFEQDVTISLETS